jgi:hypothetical protein
MKILICHSNPRVLAAVMECSQAAGNLVINCPHGRDLIPTIAATEPHLVVIGGDKLGFSPRELEAGLREAGFRQRTLVLRDNCQADDFHLIWQSLQSPLDSTPPFDYDLQKYTVFGEKKFGPPSSTLASAEALEEQENHLLAIMAAGAMRHSQAEDYLNAAIKTERNYQRDWISAMLAGEAKAYLWRAQLFRYISALAHYVPGVEADCLPLPHPASTKMDFLHQGGFGRGVLRAERRPRVRHESQS